MRVRLRGHRSAIVADARGDTDLVVSNYFLNVAVRVGRHLQADDFVVCLGRQVNAVEGGGAGRDADADALPAAVVVAAVGEAGARGGRRSAPPEGGSPAAHLAKS